MFERRLHPHGEVTWAHTRMTHCRSEIILFAQFNYSTGSKRRSPTVAAAHATPMNVMPDASHSFHPLVHSTVHNFQLLLAAAHVTRATLSTIAAIINFWLRSTLRNFIHQKTFPTHRYVRVADSQAHNSSIGPQDGSRNVIRIRYPLNVRIWPQ